MRRAFYEMNHLVATFYAKNWADESSNEGVTAFLAGLPPDATRPFI